MKRICLIKGQSQYDTTRTFIDRLADAFRRAGHGVHIIDMTSTAWPESLAAAFNKPLAFVFSFNAIGIDIATEGVAVYDRMRTLFIASLMDHPMYHLERIGAPVERAVIACVDRTHARFLHNHAHGARSTAFLPHGGIESPEASRPLSEREHDLVFSGTYTDPEHIRSTWSRLPDGRRQIVQDMADLMSADPAVPVENALQIVLERAGVWAGDALSFLSLKLAIEADAFVRAQRRMQCLRGLAGEGLTIDIFGDNWAASPLGTMENVRVHDAIPYSAMLHVMGRAKCVLNVLPAFPDGSHDRIFCGMLNGAVTVTDANPYIRECFTDDTHAVFFDSRQIGRLADRLRSLLRTPEHLQEIADQGRSLCREKHTWAERARTIERLAEIAADPAS